MQLDLTALDPGLAKGVKEFQEELGLTFGAGGIKLTAAHGDKLVVSSDGKSAQITCPERAQFFRGLTYLVTHGDKPFKTEQVCRYKQLSVHHATPYSAFNLETTKWFLRRLALMGYNAHYLYMESNLELEGEPFFGYLEPKYTRQEMKEIAAYGDLLGVEVIPTLELLAHQPKLKNWKKYSGLYDLEDVLNVGKKEVYELIEKIIKTCSECFTSHKIHLGLDEAHYLGHGQYFRENGLKPRIELFLNHLDKLVKLSEKYGYTEQMIWSDMLYTEYNDYYYWGKNQLPEEVIKAIPESVTLVYWDYYNSNDNHLPVCFKNHNDTGRNVIFGGGVWTWEGMCAHNRWTVKVLKDSLKVAKEANITSLMITSWGQPLAYGLPSLNYIAAVAYDDLEEERAIFKTACGCAKDAFMALDCPNYLEDNQCFVWPYSDQTLYNDYFMGLYDFDVKEEYAGVFKKRIKELQNARRRAKRYEFAFDRMIALCRICDLKYTLGIDTRRAYKAGDKEELAKLVQTRYKPLVGLYKKYHAAREKEWYTLYKPELFEMEDVYIGGMIMRTVHCMDMLTRYIEGKTDRIHELETELLPLDERGHGFRRIYSRN